MVAIFLRGQIPGFLNRAWDQSGSSVTVKWQCLKNSVRDSNDSFSEKECELLP